MKTRCPHCQASFTVTPQVLAVANGRVRCGQCEQIFDGKAHLLSDADEFAAELAALDASLGADVSPKPSPRLKVAPVIVKPSKQAPDEQALEAASSPVYDFSSLDKPIPKAVSAAEDERQQAATEILQAQRAKLIAEQKAQQQNPQESALDVELPPIFLDEEPAAPKASFGSAKSAKTTGSIDDLINSYMQNDDAPAPQANSDDLEFGSLFDDQQFANAIPEEPEPPEPQAWFNGISAKPKKNSEPALDNQSLLGNKPSKPQQEPAAALALDVMATASKDPIEPASSILAQSPLAARLNKKEPSSRWWWLAVAVLLLLLALQLGYLLRYSLAEADWGAKILAKCSNLPLCQLKKTDELEVLQRQFKSNAQDKNRLTFQLVFKNNARFHQLPPTVRVYTYNRNMKKLGFYALAPHEYGAPKTIAPQQTIGFSVDFVDTNQQTLSFDVGLI